MPGSPLSHLPLFANLHGQEVLVVGGGEVALRKVRLLERAGARISVVATALAPALQQRAGRGELRWVAWKFSPDQLEGCSLTIAATDDPVVNQEVAAAARARRLPVNVVDDAEASSVILPAIINRSPLLVAVSTGGAAPVLARRLRAEIETMIDGSWAALTALCARWRTPIVRARQDAGVRRRFYEWLVDGPVRRQLAAGQAAAAERTLAQALNCAEPQHGGSVVLVGAGPGDPGLLTLNALRALQSADVILHDRLVSDEVLDLARRDAQRIAVGKQAGGQQTGQERINDLMVEHARRGLRVVRLKGGDPFVFGRGGEELEHLRRHGIPYEVVPGITAALACAAYAGIPLTHRDYAQSVRFVTAHCQDSIDTLDWPGLARDQQTLAIYMGVGNAQAVQDRLIAHGRAASTPAAIVENGTRPGQRVIGGSLDELATLVARERVQSPALLLVGEVARLAQTLGWFGEAGQAANIVALPVPDRGSAATPRKRRHRTHGRGDAKADSPRHGTETATAG